MDLDLPEADRHRFAGTSVLIAFFLFASWSSILALSVEDEQKLLGDPIDAEGDHLGRAVATDGETIVLGASGDHVTAPYAGAAYTFYLHESGTWTWGGPLRADDGEAYDRFGGAVDVDIDGDTIVVGSPGDGLSLPPIGRAFVCERQTGDEWVLQADLLPPGAEEGDFIGASVAVDDDTVLVGNATDDDLGRDAGAVHAFVREPNGRWRHCDKLLASDGAEFDHFGGVALSGDVAVVASSTHEFGEDSGSVYVFTRNADQTWTERLKLLASDGMEQAGFGAARALLDDTLVVGAPGDSTFAEQAGAAYANRLVGLPANASEMLEGLIELVESLDLLIGIERSLVAKLETCRRTLDRGVPPQIRTLIAFIHEVVAQQGRHIEEEDAQALIAGAYEIIDLLAGTEVEDRGRMMRYKRASIGLDRQVGTIVPSWAGS